MEEQHTDGDIHNILYFSDSFDDIDIKNNEQFEQEKLKGLYKFTGDYQITDDVEELRYSIYKKDPTVTQTESPVRSEVVPVLRDGKVGEKGNAGASASFTPSSFEIYVDKFGQFVETDELRVYVTLSREETPLEIEKIYIDSRDVKELSEAVDIIDPEYNVRELDDDGEVIKDDDGNEKFKSWITFKPKTGKVLGDIKDTCLSFVIHATSVVTTQSDGTKIQDKAEGVITFNKAGQHISLGRIKVALSGAQLNDSKVDNVYWNEYDSDGNTVIKGPMTVYAQPNDVLVFAPDDDGKIYTTPNRGDVYKWDGDSWMITNDSSSLTIAFDDIMTLSEGSTVTYICNRLVANDAFIKRLFTREIDLVWNSDSEMGVIRGGYYVDPDKAAWKNKGFELKADGTVNIKGGSITLADGSDLDTKVSNQSTELNDIVKNGGTIDTKISSAGLVSTTTFVSALNTKMSVTNEFNNIGIYMSTVSGDKTTKTASIDAITGNAYFGGNTTICGNCTVGGLKLCTHIVYIGDKTYSSSVSSQIASQVNNYGVQVDPRALGTTSQLFWTNLISANGVVELWEESSGSGDIITVIGLQYLGIYVKIFGVNHDSAQINVFEINSSANTVTKLEVNNDHVWKSSEISTCQMEGIITF